MRGNYRCLVVAPSLRERSEDFFRLFWQWSDQHDHLAAFHFRKVLYAACLFGVFGDTLQQFAAKVLVRHFATPETQSNFYFVAVLKELEDITHLNFVIVRVRVRAELDLFDLDDFLLFAGLGLALLGLVFELAKVHNLANRRVCVWRNLNKIQPGFFGQNHGAGGRYNAAIFAIGANQADFRGADVLVDARASVTLWRRIVGSASDDGRPLIVVEFQSVK